VKALVKAPMKVFQFCTFKEKWHTCQKEREMNSTETNQTSDETTETSTCFAPDFQIFVPSPDTYIVKYRGTKVANWNALQEDTARAVVPIIRERWGHYWRIMALEATQHILKQESDDEPLKDVMKSGIHTLPSMDYPCPKWLADKAVLPIG
jgi:hypothetical protein